MSTTEDQNLNNLNSELSVKSLSEKNLPQKTDDTSDEKKKSIQEEILKSNTPISEVQNQIDIETIEQKAQTKAETTKVNVSSIKNTETLTSDEKNPSNNKTLDIPVFTSENNPKNGSNSVPSEEPRVPSGFKESSSSSDEFSFKFSADQKLNNTTSKPANDLAFSQLDTQPKQSGVKIKLDGNLGGKRLLSKDTSPQNSFHLSKKAKHVHDLMGMILKEFDSANGSSSNIDKAELENLEKKIASQNKIITYIGNDYIGKAYFQNFASLLQKNTTDAITLMKLDFCKLVKDIEVLKKNFNNDGTFQKNANSTVSPESQANIEKKIKQLQADSQNTVQLLNKNFKELIVKMQYYEDKSDESKESLEKYSLALKDSIGSMFKNIHNQFKAGLDTLATSKVNKSEFEDRISSLVDTTLNSSQSLQKFINSTLEDFENHKKKIEEQLTTTTKFYQNKIKNLELKIENIEPTCIQKCKQLPFDAVIFLKNYKRKVENESNADILFKPIIEYCLTYGIYLKHETMNDTDFLLTAKYNCKVIFQLTFVFDNMTLKCSPIPGYTFWEVPAVMSVDYKAELIYNYVVTYSSDVVFAVFLERDLEESQRINRCKSLLEKLGIFNGSLTTDNRVIKLLLERLDKDDDLQQMRVSKTILYRKPKLIKKILSKVDEKYIKDLESRNRVVLECVKFHRSAIRYDSLEEYKKFEPSKSIQGDKDELNSYKLWEIFPDYAFELVKSS